MTLRYTGLDDIERQTTLRFEPAPIGIDGRQAQIDLDLAPFEKKLIFIEIRLGPDEARASVRQSFLAALRGARKALRVAAARPAGVTASNEIFNETLRRSVADLAMLVSDTPQGPFPYAGIPWFSTPFGRDALITALETLWLDPGVARGVLCYLAAHQATEFNAAADSEPGKILHETRNGEMAMLGEVPFRRYYGSVNSTPLFVMLAGAYLERTGDLATIRAIWPNIEAALHWIEAEGDRDGDGFVEYGRRTSEGLVNQGWKDIGRFHLPRRWRAGARTHRFGRAASLCLRRLARRRRHGARAGTPFQGGGVAGQGGGPAAPLRRSVFR